MFRMAAYNVSDNLKEPVTEVHIGHILRRSLEEVSLLMLTMLYIIFMVYENSLSVRLL